MSRTTPLAILALALLAATAPTVSAAVADIAPSTSAVAVAVGPCEDPGALAVAECAAYNGEVLVCNALNGNDDCIRPQDAERLVCNLLFGTDDCLAIALPALGTSSAAIGIGPCDDPGALAVVQCAEENGEILVCSAVFGDQSTCITTMCRMMLDNCPLDPKGPIETTAARVDLPAEFPAAA